MRRHFFVSNKIGKKCFCRKEYHKCRCCSHKHNLGLSLNPGYLSLSVGQHCILPHCGRFVVLNLRKPTMKMTMAMVCSSKQWLWLWWVMVLSTPYHVLTQPHRGLLDPVGLMLPQTLFTPDCSDSFVSIRCNTGGNLPPPHPPLHHHTTRHDTTRHDTT